MIRRNSNSHRQIKRPFNQLKTKKFCGKVCLWKNQTQISLKRIEWTFYLASLMDQVLYQVSSNHNSLSERCLKQEETQSLTAKLPQQSSRKFTAWAFQKRTWRISKKNLLQFEWNATNSSKKPNESSKTLNLTSSSKTSLHDWLRKR